MGSRGFVVCPGVAHDRPGQLEELKARTLESLLVVMQDEGLPITPGVVGWRIVHGTGVECRRVLDSYLNEHSDLGTGHRAQVDQIHAFCRDHPQECLLVIAVAKVAA